MKDLEMARLSQIIQVGTMCFYRRKAEGSKSESTDMATDAKSELMYFEDGKGTPSQRMHAISRCWKRQGNGFFSSLQKECSSAGTLILACMTHLDVSPP